MMLRCLTIVMLCGATAAVAQQGTVQQAMPFDACLQSLQTQAASASLPPTTILDTTDTKQVRFPVSTGQVTITCSRTSQQVTITHQ